MSAEPLVTIPELSSKPVYNPLEDVASDGFVHLAKPAYTGKLWPTFWRDLGIVAVVLSVIMGLLYLAYLRSQPEPVEATQPAVADMGKPISQVAKQPSLKAAIKKKATQAINTPAIAEITPEIPAPVASNPLTIRPSPLPAVRGPERPLPPSPPFPSLPPN